MASKRVQRKQQQHTDSHTAVYAAGFLFLLGLLTAAGIVLDTTGGILGFVAECELYLLGKGSFVLPWPCFLLSLKLFWDGKLGLWQKKTLAFFLVMLCLLGTAHHVFVPVTDELTPHLLPTGGGLVGGMVVLPLHRYLGNMGTWLALVLGWLGSLGLLLPVGIIWGWLDDLLGAITGRSDQELEAALQQEIQQPQKKQDLHNHKGTAFKPAVASKAQRSEGKEAINKVYRSGEFGSFTEGIEKKRSFKSILGVIDNPYDKEPLKQELEQDPIQLPEWQEKPHEVERERNIVLRPVINYDSTDAPAPMPGRRFLEAVPAPEAATQPRPASQHAHGAGSVHQSIIHNEYRELKQKEALEEQEPAKGFDFELASEDPAPAAQGQAAAEADKYADKRQIAIYDSAEKIQGAEQEAAPVAANSAANVAPAAGEEQGTACQPAYTLPPLELLNSPKLSDPNSYQRDIMEQCAILEQTLADFRVRAKVIAVTRGPSVTRFELEPAPGVKVSSVVNLADDIALRLAAPGVRIEAPIPGKSAIGI